MDEASRPGAGRTRDAQWLREVARRVNEDAEMGVIGGQFDATISFTFGAERHDLVVRSGKVADLRHGRKLDWRSDFGFRAPEAVWDRFFQSPPPPLYNNVFAMIMRVPDFQVEGDTLVLAQNARAFTRFMSVMQEAGAA
jgi:hypothetical protein